MFVKVIVPKDKLPALDKIIDCIIYNKPTTLKRRQGAIVFDTESVSPSFLAVFKKIGKIGVEAGTVNFNSIDVYYDYEVDVIVLTYDGRRHALHDDGNNVGWVFNQLFYDGERLMVEDLVKCKVLKYRSARLDAKWWEFGLDAPKLKPVPKSTNINSYVDWFRNIKKPCRDLAIEKLRNHFDRHPEIVWAMVGPRATNPKEVIMNRILKCV